MIVRIAYVTVTLLLLGNVAAASLPPHEAMPGEKACPIPDTAPVQVIEKSITIDRAPKDVYAFWRDPSHLPEFMERVESVEVLDKDRSQWIFAGPLGVRVQWNVEILSETEPHDLDWCTKEGGLTRYHGSVRFTSDPSSGATQAALRLTLRLPGHPLRVAMALSGYDPETEVETSLHRLKERLERNEN